MCIEDWVGIKHGSSKVVAKCANHYIMHMLRRYCLYWSSLVTKFSIFSLHDLSQSNLRLKFDLSNCASLIISFYSSHLSTSSLTIPSFLGAPTIFKKIIFPHLEITVKNKCALRELYFSTHFYVA